MGHGKKSYSNGLEALSLEEKFAGWRLVSGGGGRPNLMYSPGPGLSPGTLDLLDLTWDLDLDLSLTITKAHFGV